MTSNVVESFNTAQIARISGFSIRQLDYWAKTGMLVPSISRSSGPGTRKLYSFDDLVRIQFIKQLHSQGWSTQKSRQAIEQLGEFMSERPDYRNFRLISDKNTILILCETEEKQQILLDALNPSGQQVLWIILEMLQDEARRCTAQLLNMPTLKPDSATLDEAI